MKYRFGVDYYPEHWPRERWRTDARMMREMGIGIVRMAEFSWAKWEPREGEFHFEALDEAIGALAAEGIDCILGTPTAAPPAWIIRRNPEIQPVDANGHTRAFGGRHHDCQSNPVYRAHVRRFVTAFAAHYAKNPHVVGWQVDNELGNSHADLCYCASCQASFRRWLQEKYKTVEELNRCWGTAFWSQDYGSFEEVTAPVATASGHNPSQELDWKRFCSDLVLDFHRFQADILRAAAPDKFITHNMMGFSDKFDYGELGKQLDFASQDQYPGGHFRAREDAHRPDCRAAELDFIRAVKRKPFWILEQQAGITGWEILGRAPFPGQLGLWAMQSIAHGADTVMFFRWRSCAMGTEQYWHGILPHNGVPGRFYREIRDFIARYGALLGQVQGGMPEGGAAILFSYEQAYAFAIQPHHPELNYVGHLMSYYGALYRRNIPVSFVREEDDWDAYPVLIAPLQFLMTPRLSAKLHAYVEKGGTLTLDFRCGVRDEHNLSFTEGPVPHMLDDLCGVTVAEYDCLRDADGLVRWDGEEYACSLWSDVVETTAAEPLAVYAKEFYAGTPAIARNRYGKGTVYYVGTHMSPALAGRFVRELEKGGALTPLLDAPEGVEAVCRRKGNARYLFVLNHTDKLQRLAVPATWRSACDGQGDPGALEPYGVRVFVRPAEGESDR